MKLYIHGHGPLAAATRTCCGRHFEIVEALPEAEILWLCEDTPVSASDASNVEAVLDGARLLITLAQPSALILVSSQLPVGTTAILEGEFPGRVFAYSPENIRVATAVEDFEQQARIVVGIRPGYLGAWRLLLDELLLSFTDHIIYTDIETAEMVKHAVNGYLALCIAYINEVDTICRKVGASGSEVSRCLMLDRRVSPRAPLKPGAPYGLGHLARDVYTMTKLGGVLTPLVASIKPSNDRVVR